MQKSPNASKAIGLSSSPHLMFDPNLFFYKSTRQSLRQEMNTSYIIWRYFIVIQLHHQVKTPFLKNFRFGKARVDLMMHLKNLVNVKEYLRHGQSVLDLSCIPRFEEYNT